MEKKSKSIIRKLTFLALAGIIAYTIYNLFLLKPNVVGLDQLEKIPRKKEVSLLISPRAHVSGVRVKVVQGAREVLLFEGELPREVNEVRFLVEADKLGIEDGPAEVVVELLRLFLWKESYRINAFVDTRPPRIRVVHAPYTVLQGGSGAIRVRSSEPVEAFVEVGGWHFRFYEVEENTYVALFGIPPTTSPREVIKVIATDGVGNRTVLSLGTGIRRNNFKRVKVELKGREKFLRPKLLAVLGEGGEEEDFLKLFKKVNEDIRKENTEKIKEIGSGSAPERYWSGNFLQHKRSKVISRYGERRVYTYGGKLISRSWHLGYDLASVKNSEVLAANRGKVVFAGDLGIYGNTVIIDHGMGLMSLYSHLADFVVEEGDLVEKGQLIGFTDMTGLAFGDHLHFGVLVGGLEVTPLEWWDPKWVKNRIEPAFSG